MESMPFESESGKSSPTENITYVCFVGPSQQEILGPLWYYGRAIRRILIFYNADHANVAAAVHSEVTNDPIFSGAEIRSFHYSRKYTNIDSFKSYIEKRIPMEDDEPEIIVNISGCSKPVFLAMILFANEHDASIILSVKYRSFEIFEDGAVRVQPLPHRVKWYLSHHKLRVFPRISSDRTKDPVIPERVLKGKPDLIQEYLMESTITGKGWTLNVDFAFTTRKRFIFGKMFTEEGESFDQPSRILAESPLYFGTNCRILIYAVGEDLARRLQQRLGKNKYVTVVTIPDPWCLVEYPEYFELDLMGLAN